MKVFISHLVEEAPLALVLKDWLESIFLGQVEVFVSSEENDVTAGDQWFRRIEAALSEAKVLLIICSPLSVYKPWINFEAGAGWIKKVPVIPVCHSGMEKGLLPIPLSFFQALDVEDSDFARKIVAAIAKHLGYTREPRIPHQEMLVEIQEALQLIAEKAGNFIQDEEMGFIDHLVAMQDNFAELSEAIILYGEHTTRATVETEKFSNQSKKAQANQSEGTERHLQKIAKKFGEKLEAYAQHLKSLNERYADVLPQAERSLQYVITFKNPETEEEREAISSLLTVLDSTEVSISGFQEAAISTHQIMSEQPNYQRHMRRAIREVVNQYDILIQNLDKTLDMIDQARAVLKYLQ